MPTDRGKGRIYRELWIESGRCDYCEPLGCATGGVAAASLAAWRRNRQFGWVCETCAAEIRDGLPVRHADEDRLREDRDERRRVERMFPDAD